jgi:hypothetical protein
MQRWRVARLLVALVMGGVVVASSQGAVVEPDWSQWDIPAEVKDKLKDGWDQVKSLYVGNPIDVTAVQLEYFDSQWQEAGNGSGAFSLAKYVKPRPDYELEALVFFFDSTAKNGWHVLDNESIFNSPNNPPDDETYVQIGTTIEIYSVTAPTAIHFETDPAKMIRRVPGMLCKNDPNAPVGSPADRSEALAFLGSDRLWVHIDDQGVTDSQDVELSKSLGDDLSPFEYTGTGDPGIPFNYKSTLSSCHRVEVSPFNSWSFAPDFQFRAAILYVGVPEPTTTVLLSVGLIPLLRRRRRRR